MGETFKIWGCFCRFKAKKSYEYFYRHNCAQEIVIANSTLVSSEMKCTATKNQKILTGTTQTHRSK